jgi:AraC-like DNA-binding protein
MPMAYKIPQQLAKNVAGIPEPANYFGGTAAPTLELPRTVLIFSRKTSRQLGTANSYHYRYVLVTAIKTGGTAMVDNGMYRLLQGNAFLVFPYQFHRFLELQSTSLSWLFITFELSSPDSIIQLKNVPLPLNGLIISYMERIISLYHTKTLANSTSVVFLTALILNELKNIATRIPAKKTSANPAPNVRLQIIDKINQYIYSNIQNPIAVGEIARHVSISGSHLRALYRKQVGMSLGRCISEIRLLKAMGLLESAEMNISQVAFACGYDSLFSFSRAFKRRFALSPRDFKKGRKLAN